MLFVFTGSVIADETEPPSDWVDVDDYGDWLWLRELSPFEWKLANRLTIAANPQFYPGELDSIIQQLSSHHTLIDSATASSMIKLPPERIASETTHQNRVSLKVTSITGRKFGDTTDDDLERYNGNPIASTNRFALTVNDFDCGMTIDKDAFEPRFNDLTRFWGRYRNENSLLIFGDYHITIGRGLALWTKPTYTSSFDHASSYRPSSNTASPAGDSSTNSALRGVAFQHQRQHTSLTLFGAQTKLDAISAEDSTGLMLRLSATGLHRTIGEDQKKNLVTETVYGGAVSHEILRNQDKSMALFLAGYTGDYKPGFSGETSSRIRFPLCGSHFGAFSGGWHYAGKRVASFAEVATDLTDKVAWSISGSVSAPSSNIGVDGVIFSTPAGFQSARSRDPFEGTFYTGCEGAAMHIRGNPRESVINFWRAHLEVMHIPWRSYTVPTPSVRSRFSLEGGLKLRDNVTLELRYRQRQSDDGHGEEAAVEQFTDQRLRARLHLDIPSLGRQTIWVEGVARESDVLEDGNGVGCGFKQQISIRMSKRHNISINEVFSLAYFSTTNGAVVYYGEAGVPGRVRVVALSGNGLRWSGVAGFELGQISRIYFKAAQTIRNKTDEGASDIEIWAGLSYYIHTTSNW